MRALLFLGRQSLVPGSRRKDPRVLEFIFGERSSDLKIKPTRNGWHSGCSPYGTRMVNFALDFQPYPEIETGKFCDLDSKSTLDCDIVWESPGSKTEICGNIRVQYCTGRVVAGSSMRVSGCAAPTTRHADSVVKTRRRDPHPVATPISSTVCEAAALPTGMMGVPHTQPGNHSCLRVSGGSDSGKRGRINRESTRSCREGIKLRNVIIPRFFSTGI